MEGFKSMVHKSLHPFFSFAVQDIAKGKKVSLFSDLCVHGLHGVFPDHKHRLFSGFGYTQK
jgi:hypothetical protein